MLLQFVVILLMSISATYAFQSTTTNYQINGLCFYRYVAYAAAILLGYVCFSNYSRYVALIFGLALSVLAFSPIGLAALELFPSIVGVLAGLMGVTTILVVPTARGKGFFELLVVLVAPAILAESRIGGSANLLAVTRTLGYHELTAVTVCIVGGYLYLRYAALANANRRQLLSDGGGEEDVAKASELGNLVSLLVVAGASAAAACLMLSAFVVTRALQATALVIPLGVLVLAMGVGITIVIAIVHMYQLPNRDVQK